MSETKEPGTLAIDFFLTKRKVHVFCSESVTTLWQCLLQLQAELLVLITQRFCLAVEVQPCKTAQRKSTKSTKVIQRTSNCGFE